jgi:hypothetical protein
VAAPDLKQSAERLPAMELGSTEKEKDKSSRGETTR